MQSMVTLLLESGADVDIKNESGESVFDLDGVDNSIITLLRSKC